MGVGARRCGERTTCSCQHAVPGAQQANATCGALRSIRDELGLVGTAPIEKVSAHVEQLQILQERIENFAELRAVLDSALPAEFDDVFETSVTGLTELVSLLEVTGSLPPELWSRRADHYKQRAFRASMDDLEPQVVELRAANEHLLRTFNLERLPESRTLEDLQQILDSHGILFCSFCVFFHIHRNNFSS